MSYKRDNIKEPIKIKKILLVTLLQEEYANYHFREQVTQKGIVFDYKIHHGVASTTNAIKLIEVLGYEQSIIEKANRLVSLI